MSLTDRYIYIKKSEGYWLCGSSVQSSLWNCIQLLSFEIVSTIYTLNTVTSSIIANSIFADSKYHTLNFTEEVHGN